jgi:membrane protein implicated in regulation of membrane protease activity
VKRLRWDGSDRTRPFPRHPYRDTAFVYAGLAMVVVVLALVTGGGIARAFITAAIVFVVATLWSWRTWRNRLRERDRQEERSQ